MQPIARIADIPFFEKPPRELLGIVYGREQPELEYYEYGYGHLDLVCLVQPDNLDQPIIRNALVLALHSADDGEAMTDDIELEFFVDEIAEDYSVTVLLSRFLEVWLPLVARDEAAIVLALCNPHRARMARPVFAAGVPVYYALGDVVAVTVTVHTPPLFLRDVGRSEDFQGGGVNNYAVTEYCEGREFFHLHADRWLLAE